MNDDSLKNKITETLNNLGIVNLQDKVLVLEGSRRVNYLDEPRLFGLGSWLGRTFPDMTYRSGNAEGADRLFIEGILENPKLTPQLICPYPKHRESISTGRSVLYYPQSLSLEEREDVILLGSSVSTEYQVMFQKRLLNRSIKVKTDYLIRDILKIKGSQMLGIKPANLAIFYYNPKGKQTSGTAFTRAICEKLKVPFVMVRPSNLTNVSFD